MLEIGRESVYGEASDELLAEAASELIKEATGWHSPGLSPDSNWRPHSSWNSSTLAAAGWTCPNIAAEGRDIRSGYNPGL